MVFCFSTDAAVTSYHSSFDFQSIRLFCLPSFET